MQKVSMNAPRDGGHIPTIVCINNATRPPDVTIDVLVPALQSYVDDHVAPVWGTPAKLVKGTEFIKGAWAIQFLDDPDQSVPKWGKLAYHDLTPDGLPFAKVFVHTSEKQGESVSVAASHELVEMLVDPAINIMTTGPKSMGAARIMYAYESADPVEALSFDLGGVQMCNFLYPSYFETFREPNSTQFDHMNIVTRPFEILTGGYQIVFKKGKWSIIHGSPTKAKAFRREDRRGHRSEARRKGGALRRAKKLAARG